MIKKKYPYKLKGRKVVQSTKTVIDGIQFASKLESIMYKLLKTNNIKNEYEGKSYVTFEPLTYGGECYERYQKRSDEMIDRPKVLKVSYTPDFVGDNEEWIIECKGRANESFPIRWKLFKQLMNKRKVKPLIFKPTNVKDCEQVIKILKMKGYDKNK